MKTKIEIENRFIISLFTVFTALLPTFAGIDRSKPRSFPISLKLWFETKIGKENEPFEAMVLYPLL